VLGTRRPLGHFLDWYVGAFPLTAADRFAMVSGLGHDPLLRDVLAPLTLGAALCIPDPALLASPVQLADWLAREAVSVLHLTPALGRLLTAAAAEPLPALRHAFFGGDRLTPVDVDRFRELAPNARCVNFYGATETPQAIACHEIPAGPAGGRPGVPLGRGIRDVQLFVLTPAGRLAGVGEPGEIHVRTPHLARGYLDDPALTAARFVPGPPGGAPGERCYRTGDVGAYLPDGDVEFLGRADHQVKVRGYRVEPGEVEAVVRQHPGLADAAVSARAEDDGGGALVAYVVPAAGAAPGPAELRRWLLERLPEHMLPGALVTMAALPRTPNGKVDRAALPAPDRTRPADGGDYVAPDTWLERALAGIWREVLRLGAVGAHDNFFDLGGTSLAVAEVQGRIREVLGRELRIVDLFTYPNVAALAEFLSGGAEQVALSRAARRIQTRADARTRRAQRGSQVSTE
jgi:acyl-coenzyme A synthetase/AMP-(fatty) acid ligase